MQIHLIAVGQRMPDWVTQGYQEYARRMPAQCALHLTEVALRKRGKGVDWKRLQAEEGEKMLAAAPAAALWVALDERGIAWDTRQLSAQLDEWRQQHSSLALLVGGPEGLAPACLSQARHHWSLSKLTLPHPLVRILVAEQLYRAWTLLHNHPYHRE